MLDDKPVIYNDPENAMRWKPNNAGEKFRGRLPLRTALKDSINTPAIRLTEAVGIRNIIDNARRLGITTDLKRELGTALGSSCTTMRDLLRVYSALNRGGERRPFKFIRKIVDRDGTVLFDDSAPSDPVATLATRLNGAYQRLSQPTERALSPQTAFLMTALMRNVVMEGTAVAASNIGFPVAGKTGTTNDSFDAWFSGFSSDTVTAVWIGHDKKERPLGIGEYGGKTALPAWIEFMRGKYFNHRKKPVRLSPPGDFLPPPGIVEVAIDPETGLLARPTSARAVIEYYREGSEPTEFTPDAVVIDPTEMNLFDADTPL